MTNTAADLVAQARATIRETEPTEIRQRLAAAAIIDVREPAEYATGHIPGAINIPRGMLEFQIDNHPLLAKAADAAAERSRPIVVYCQTGGRAALAAATLRELGYSNVESIKGGIRAWAEAELALAT
jgi:rhodanese-related sulfurtransferase